MKNRIKFIVAFVAFCCIGFAQNKVATNSNEKATQVKVKPIIYLLGGIVSSVGEKEIEFAQKYAVEFHDFGCLAPTNLEDYEKLNYKTFDLLTIQFGVKWQEELKPTVLGFAKWKAKNK